MHFHRIFEIGPSYLHQLRCTCHRISIGLPDEDAVTCDIYMCICGCISSGFLYWVKLYAPSASAVLVQFQRTFVRGQSMHHIHLRLLVHSQRTFGLDWFVCTRCPCVCWCHSIVLLAGPEGAHNLPLRLLVLPYRIYGLDQIMCTVCICVAYASPLDFWNGPECMHHVQLRSLVHLHWISD